VDGVTTFGNLVKSIGAPIRTRKHRTPRDGIHLLFAHPGESVKNSAGQIAAGVDTRGDGGYIILPPSKTETGEYRVESDIASAPLPEWLVGLFRRHGIMAARAGTERSAGPPVTPAPAREAAELTKTTRMANYVQAAVDKEMHRVAGAAEGTRNATLNEAAFALGQLVGAGVLFRGDAERALLDGAFRCGLSEHEAAGTIRSGLNGGQNEPRRLPEASRDDSRSRGGASAESRPAATRAPVLPTFHIVTAAPHEAPDEWEPTAPLGGLSANPPGWPWAAFPFPLREMGEAIERTFGVSPEMAGAAVLGVASIALGNKAKVVLKRDHWQFGNLFFLVTADVAAGKTPVTRAAQAPLIEWYREHRRQWVADCRTWQAGKNIREAQIRGLEDQAKRHSAGNEDDGELHRLQQEIERLRSEIGDRPAEPVLFCDDVTSEALGRRMAERGGAIGVLSGEARKILSIAKGRYVEGGDIDLWLAGHAGEYKRVDRSSRDKPPYEIAEACLAAMIMTQPDSLQAMGDSECLRESGFLARWLYLLPEHNRGSYPVESVPAAVAMRYSGVIRALVDMRLAELEDGASAPHLVTLHTAAFERWREFHDATITEISEARETRTGTYLQWLSKLPEHVARLALLFHATRFAADGRLAQINTELDDAIRLADVLKVHARRAFALMGADAETARARKVWTWLDKNREKLRGWRNDEGLPAVEAAKAKDLHRYEVAGVRNSAEAEAALRLLADKGYVQAVDVRPPNGKAQRLFYLRPADNVTRATSVWAHPIHPIDPTQEPQNRANRVNRGTARPEAHTSSDARGSSRPALSTVADGIEPEMEEGEL